MPTLRSALAAVLFAAAATAADPAPFKLNVRPPDLTGDKADGGLLLRELARQAVLIAARDEMHLTTRDGVLGELPGKPDPAAFDITTHCGVGEKFTVSLTRGGKPVWEAAFPVGAKLDYAAITAEFEKLSRTEIPAALKKAGVEAGKAPTAELKAAADGVAALTDVSQFAALRELHAAAGPPGLKYAGLIRAYANLGQLTAFHWNAGHKAFKARALLYAQRWAVAEPKSGPAVRHRGYALALAGFPAEAEKAFAAAEKLGGDTPDWLPAVAAYCQRDFPKLSEIGLAAGPPAKLATLLAYLTLEEKGRSASAFTLFTGQALKDSPDFYRFYDGLFLTSQLGVIHQVCETGPPALMKHFPDAVKDLNALPSDVRDAINTANDPKDKLAAALTGLTKAAAADTAEPSWAMLARVGKETVFTQAARDLDRYLLKLGRPPEECVDVAKKYLPLVGDHPYRDFITAFTVDARRQPDVHKGVLQGIALTDVEFTALPLIDALRKHDAAGASPGLELARLSIRHRDDTADDLVQTMIRQTDPARRAEAAKELRAVSPHTTAAVTVLIADDWQNQRKNLAALEKEFAEEASVQLALGRQLTAAKDYPAAERCLKASLRLTPDGPAYLALAELFKAQKDFVKWQATLDEYLKTEDLGLGHARVRTNISQFLREQKRPQDAKPYALEAAQTYAAWAMLEAAEVHEQLGEWQDAEKFVRQTAEHYDSSAHSWFFWCVRTGHGDQAAAAKLARRRVESLRGGTDGAALTIELALTVAEGKPDEAYKSYLEFLTANTGTRTTQLHAAVLAHELKNDADRTRWLDAAIKKGDDEAKNPPKTPPPAPRTATEVTQAKLRVLYAQASKVAAAIKPETADLKAADAAVALVDKDYRGDLQYIVARTLELRGDKAGAQKYYLATLDGGASNRVTTALAAYRMREMGKK